ncbi:TIGR03758 family integrating conjugative element protein [uncultured Pseudoteredinibacter sp.]|uniref:TIGR03758 family integrating conjugative element protein n=1 Tax=uncultured Pseudoteredinibacter sp. TaxID=1641701 RepID=UPI00261BE090|nr:TIGR03758 family integrating conjugative element protein [uncultured Pseudoteredinibacter sp.]
MTAAQQQAFTDATLGLSTGDFRQFILIVLFSVLYLWVAWLAYGQWKAFEKNKIDLFDFMSRVVRSIVITLVMGFLLK